MLRSIRKKHKIIWLALAVLLPVLFVVSIVWRHSEPVNDDIPKAVSSEQ